MGPELSVIVTARTYLNACHSVHSASLALQTPQDCFTLNLDFVDAAKQENDDITG